MPLSGYKDHVSLTVACLALASSVYVLSSTRNAPSPTSTDTPSTEPKSIAGSVLKGRRARKLDPTPVTETEDVTPVDPNKPWKRIVQVWSVPKRPGDR